MTKTDLDHSRHLLGQLGFEQAPQLLAELVEQSVRDELSLTGFLDLVCQREQDFRQERRIRTALKLSGLPVGKTLDSFDFAFQRGVDKGQIDLLATSEFSRRKENVLLLGPPVINDN